MSGGSHLIGSVDADARGITISFVRSGQAERHLLSWAEARIAAAQDDLRLRAVYGDILDQARAICPPQERRYHDPCEHEHGICRPMIEQLDADQVEAEAQAHARQRALGAEIDRYRDEAR